MSASSSSRGLAAYGKSPPGRRPVVDVPLVKRAGTAGDQRKQKGSEADYDGQRKQPAKHQLRRWQGEQEEVEWLAEDGIGDAARGRLGIPEHRQRRPVRCHGGAGADSKDERDAETEDAQRKVDGQTHRLATEDDLVVAGQIALIRPLEREECCNHNQEGHHGKDEKATHSRRQRSPEHVCIAERTEPEQVDPGRQRCLGGEHESNDESEQNKQLAPEAPTSRLFQRINGQRQFSTSLDNTFGTGRIVQVPSKPELIVERTAAGAMGENHRIPAATVLPFSVNLPTRKGRPPGDRMAPQDWISPNSTDCGLTPAAAPRPVSAYDLRPLAVGEILDRVLSIYRAHFWLLVGLSAASAGVSVGVAVLRLVFTYFSRITIGSISYTVVTAGFAFVQGGLYLIAYSLTLAATTSAVNSIYLGEPTSIGTALRTARRLWLRCLGVAFWQGWSATWAFCLLLIPVVLLTLPGVTGPSSSILLGIVVFVGFLAGIVYGVIAYLRNSLAVPAAVIEDLGVRAAMRRSKDLATGRIGRIFLHAAAGVRAFVGCCCHPVANGICDGAQPGNGALRAAGNHAGGHLCFRLHGWSGRRDRASACSTSTSGCAGRVSTSRFCCAARPQLRLLLLPRRMR